MYRSFVPLSILAAMAAVLFSGGGGQGTRHAPVTHFAADTAIVQPALRPAANLSDLLDAKTARGKIGITEVPVHLYATGGNGTVNSPWTGSDTAITWTNITTYRCVKGYYRLSAAWQLGN